MINALGALTADYEFDGVHVDPSNLRPETNTALESFNAQYAHSPENYFEDLHSTLQNRGGLPYAHIRRPGDSTTDVLILQNGFGGPIKPATDGKDMADYVDAGSDAESKALAPNRWNKLILSGFVHHLLREAEITDEEGNSLPLITIPSPAIDHKSPLNASDRRAVSRGDFSPFAYRNLNIATSNGYGRVYAGGHSFGGVVSGSTMEIASKRNLDPMGVLIADAPTFKDRYPRIVPLGVAKPYLFDSKGYKTDGGNWYDDGPAPRIEVAKHGESYDIIGNWVKNNAAINFAIARGLSRKTLDLALERLDANDIPTTLEKSDSKLMKGFEKFLDQDPSAEALSVDGLLLYLNAKNVPHISGENQVFMADSILRAVDFAIKNR